MLLPRTSDFVGEVTPSIVASWFASRASSVIEHGNATDATAYLRVASLSIALYDILATLQGEWRLYASQKSVFKMTRACVLFILVRYLTVAAMIISNVGFFGTGFGATACKHYQLAAPVTKLMAAVVSQLIISIRTYAVSRKAPWVLYTLSVLFVLCLIPEILGNVWKRVPVQNASKNCTSGNLPAYRVAWLHYLAAAVFDTVATTISTVYLISQSPGRSMISGISRLMLHEGILFFVFMTLVNILNLVLFKTSSIAAQSSAATLGQAVTMIMSQRLILSLHDWRASSSAGVTASHSEHNLHNIPGVTTLGRSTNNRPKGTTISFARSQGGVDLDDRDGTVTRSDLGGVHVHVDTEVKLDYTEDSDTLDERDKRDRDVKVKHTV